MVRGITTLLVGLSLTAGAWGQAQTNVGALEIDRGDRLEAGELGPGKIMSWADVAERQRELEARGEIGLNKRPAHGEWAVPSRRMAMSPHSGERYIANKWGDTEMGIGFGRGVTLHGVWVAGQGSGEGAWARGLRVRGYSGGELVGTTEWFTEIDGKPSYFDISLEGVDRVVFEARPGVHGAAWYALDDLAFGPVGSDPSDEAVTVLDFEDLRPRQKLTDSGYAGLEWEVGTGTFFDVPEAIPAPVGSSMEDEIPVVDGDRGEVVRGGGATPPTLTLQFEGVRRGEANQFSFPPDCNGAVGPDHYMVAVNTTIAVYLKGNGARVQLSSLGSFQPGTGGDPRILFDQHSQRWIVVSTDFSNEIFVNVSLTDDPTGNWFATSFFVNTGPDAGCSPDFPTLGVDQNGIYITAFMFNNCGHTLWVLDKAPLIAPSPSLGSVTRFTNLPFFVGAIQPVQTFGTPPGQYLVETDTADNPDRLIIRRVDPPANSPTLTTVGSVTIPATQNPPNAPALGSSTPLDTVGTRLSQSVYRDGSIWTSHCIGFNGRAAVRWYEVDVATLSAVQAGLIEDSSLHYFMPSIMVNANGDAVVAFSGSDASTRPAAFFAGRFGTETLGQMSDPQLYRNSNAVSYNLIDGFGRNRWGDYTSTSLDPMDEETIWTIQEFVFGSNTWSTEVAKLEFTPTGPQPFNLVTPGVNATGVALSPFFQWGVSQSASDYVLEVDDDPSFGSPEIDQTTILNQFQAVGDPLTQSTEYFWRVVAENTFGSTTSTPPSSSFVTQGPAPGSFVQFDPQDAATVTQDPVTFQWTASTVVGSYTLEVDDEPSFSAPLVIEETGIAPTPSVVQFTPPAGILQDGETYYWRATAVNAVGQTSALPGATSFTLDLTPAGCEGDADGNGVVDVNDLTFVVNALGSSVPACTGGDVDGNGVVDVNDITFVVNLLGTCNPPVTCP